MKASSQIFGIILLCLLIVPASFAQPCLNINSESETACANQTTVVSSTGNAVYFHLEDVNAGLETHPGVTPRYSAFWIFGDGNFRAFSPNLEPADDLLTHSQNYSYPPVAASYDPEVLLTEKKSNTSPPPRPHRKIAITGTGDKFGNDFVPGSGFNYRIGPNQSMDVLNSERNRPKYPTAFVVSAPKGDAQINRVFFFFNSMRFRNETSYHAETLHDLSNFSINLPNYVAAVTPPATMPDVSALGTAYLPDFVQDLRPYQNYFEIPVSNDTRSNIPNSFSEFRFFPILHSIWNPRWIVGQDTMLPISRYLAVSVGSQPRFNKDSDLSDVLAQQFMTQVHSHFSSVEGPEFQISNDPPLYIRGVDTLDVEMVASIDPNGLTIRQICPKGNDRYQVTIKMEVCNEGYMHESDFTFRLTDQSGLLSEPSFSGNSEILSLPAPPTTGPTHSWEYQWDTYLDAVPYPLDPAAKKTEAEVCVNTNFWVETNWAGVQSLVAGKALRLCVKFTYANDKCTNNYPLDSRELCPEAGFACGGTCPPAVSGSNCCCWTIASVVLLAIVLLLLIWMIWRLVRKKLA
ncbi:MAG: hypothetical protein IT260_04030 [Saprospiraceae bacterium]|nr:hypothetical protein [Saprospiraceae bacterium]